LENLKGKTHMADLYINIMLPSGSARGKEFFTSRAVVTFSTRSAFLGKGYLIPRLTL